MVSESNTGRCASGRLRPKGGWTRGGVLARTLNLEGGVDCEIPHMLGRRTKHSL